VRGRRVPHRLQETKMQTVGYPQLYSIRTRSQTQLKSFGNTATPALCDKFDAVISISIGLLPWRSQRLECYADELNEEESKLAPFVKPKPKGCGTQPRNQR
jgi:hypothetical protein